MTRYRIEFARSAAKDFNAIRDRRIRDPIERAIQALADDPRPATPHTEPVDVRQPVINVQ